MFKRKTLTPARIKPAIIPGVSVAGPMVAIIFVFLIRERSLGETEGFAIGEKAVFPRASTFGLDAVIRESPYWHTRGPRLYLSV
jgi:hypothetical protein